MIEDDRILKEDGLAARVAHVIYPVLEDLNYRLVKVTITGAQGCTVQIMAEREDGFFAIEDCEKASHAISPLLDTEDLIHEAYHLEMSSPGIDRPLVRAQDFERWEGFEARIELTHLMDGRKKFRGVLKGIKDHHINLLLTQDGKSIEHNIALEHIGDAKLILTDDLISESLKRQNNETS